MVAPLKDLLVELNLIHMLDVSTSESASLLLACWLELAGEKVCCINNFLECSLCMLHACE